MRLKHFSLLFSIIGILFLYFLSRISQPPLIGIDEMSSYDGKQVILSGIVIEHHLTKYGSQIIKIESNNETTTVFVEGKTEIEFGDKIKVTGEVQKYENDWELVVNDINFVKVMEKWHNISVPLWQLADNPSRYLGLNINVTGYIESISNAYFCIVDIDGKYSLPVFYDLKKNFTISPGQKVIAFGRFSFDAGNFRYKLELIEETHGVIPSIEE